MRRVAILALSVGVTVLVPALLVVNGARVLANDWYVRFEYGRDGFPPDRYGLTREQRTELALTGLHSILPQYDEGIQLLREARLPSSRPAFDDRELTHMADVRALVDHLYVLHLAALGAIAVLAVALGLSGRARTVVPRALRRGAILSLVLAAGVVAYVLTSYGAFSTDFHGLFFGGDSWRFAETETLRRLYPDRFWSDTAILLGAGAVAQALVLLGATRLWLRRGKAIPARARTERT